MKQIAMFTFTNSIKRLFVTVKILTNVTDMFTYWIEQSKKVNDSHIKTFIKGIRICAIKEKDVSSSSIIKKWQFACFITMTIT